MPVRNLTATEQEWRLDTDFRSQIYNTPHSTGRTLDAKQGKVVLLLDNGDELGFSGTCGLVSCVNILRLAGRTETTEKEVLEYALFHGLCQVTMDPEMNGGTGANERRDILMHFGLESEVLPSSVEDIAKYVSQGKGVIISVDAGELWQDPRYLNGYHAITVTSVKKDMDGNLLGFFICDSGSGQDDFARYCDANFLANALSKKPMNVTTAIIR